MENKKGKLYIVGTPIGNLGDITVRALETLKSVGAIYCEDTRHTGMLLAHFGIKCKLVSCYKQSERSRVERAAKDLDSGIDIALVTDAGMPCISDPGAVLVSELGALGYEIESVPGPSAVTTAVALSGINAAGFVFCGFLPEKKKDADDLIKRADSAGLPIVLYCAPHDLGARIAYLLDALGDRKIISVKEMTKLYETVYRGTLSEPNILNESGEFVLIILPAEKSAADIDILGALKVRVAKGMSRADAVKEVAAEYKLSKNAVYAESLKL